MNPIFTFSAAESIGLHWNGALKNHYEPRHFKRHDQLLEAVRGQVGALLLFHTDTASSAPAEILALIRAEPGLKILALSDIPSFQEGEGLLRIGIKGYGNARLHPAALIQALEVIEAGNHWFYPDFMQHLVLAAVRGGKETDTFLLESLSDRERETAMMAADGLHNREIAEKMGITERTVKAHLGAIFAKLGVKDRIGLVLKLRGK